MIWQCPRREFQGSSFDMICHLLEALQGRLKDPRGIGGHSLGAKSCHFGFTYGIAGRTIKPMRAR